MFVSLQGLITLISGQLSRLNRLIDTYCGMSGMKEPFDEEQIINIVTTHPAERSEHFVLTHKHACPYVDGLGMLDIETLQELGVGAVRHLVVCVAKQIVDAADGIDNAVSNRNDSNELSSDIKLSPMLPAELARVDMRSFVRTSQTQRSPLKRKYSDATIEEISQNSVIIKGILIRRTSQCGSTLVQGREEGLFGELGSAEYAVSTALRFLWWSCHSIY